MINHLSHLVRSVWIYCIIACFVLIWIIVVILWITSGLLTWALIWVRIITIMLVIVVIFSPWLYFIVFAFCSFVLFAIGIEVRICIILWIAWVYIGIISVWVIFWLDVVEGIIWIHVWIIVRVIIHVAIWICWVAAWLVGIAELITIGITASASNRSLITSTVAAAATAITICPLLYEL